MECAAIGVPLYASNYEPYKRVMPKEQLFNNSDELKDKLMKLKFGTGGHGSSAGVYRKIINAQWKWLNSPCHEGDFDLKNFWLEDNLQIWIDLFRLKQKTLKISLDSFVKQNEARKKLEAEKVIKKSASGEAVITL